MECQPELIADRAYALRTCPAKAPSTDDDQTPDPDEYAANARWLYPVAVIVKEYLESLPLTQRAEVYLDAPRRRVIAQGLGLNTLGIGGSDNRLDVGVQGDVHEAWRRIAEVVDPCAFRVKVVGRPVPG